MPTLCPFLITQRKIRLLKLCTIITFSINLALLSIFNPPLLCIILVSYVCLHYDIVLHCDLIEYESMPPLIPAHHHDSLSLLGTWDGFN